MILHQRHAAFELGDRLSRRHARVPLVQSSSNVGDGRFMWVNITKATCQPAAVCVGAPQPAPELGIPEGIGKRHRQALAPRRNEVRGLVVRHRAWLAAPAILLLHLVEDVREHVADELCKVGPIV